MQNLDEILGGYSREELGAMVDYLCAPVSYRGPKKAIVAELSSFLRTSPVKWLNMLPENDLRLLQRLVNAGANKKILLLRPDYPTVAEVMKIISNDRDADYDTVEVSLSETMYEIVAPHIRRVIAAKENDGSFELEERVFGFMNTYGILPLKTFLNLFFDRYSEDEISARKLSEKISDCPLMRLYQTFYKGEVYLISPFVEDIKEIMETRRNYFKDIRKYASAPSDEDVFAAGQDAPFCAYGLNTPEGRALVQMLEEEFGFSGEELKEALHTVWIDSQFAIDDEATQHLFSVVTDRQDELGSFELFRECIETVVDYANSVPKWLLKGHSSNETNTMRITVRVDELVKEYNYDEPGLNLYKMGLAVRPVPPDEPCPCGSGLSYRFCHGRWLN